jgi:hypothetical protein
MDTIIIAVVVILLGAWWARLLVRQRDADNDDTAPESGDGEDSLDGLASGGYHPAGVEYWSQTHERTVEPHPPAPGVCPTCETENDPAYTYCRNCVGRLRPA